MKNLFKDIQHVQFEGKNSTNPLSYRFYNASQVILDKTMEEHLRIAVCFWHTLSWGHNNMLGETLFERAWHYITDPMQLAETRIHAAFEFIEKLGIKYFTFFDTDIAPEGKTLRETQKNLQLMSEKIALEMERTNIKLLWGAANTFSHDRYKAGAATNPNPEVFAYAMLKVKQAMDMTHQLNGKNFLVWGGHEKYDILLNTCLRREYDQLGYFLQMLVDYKYKIGFKGMLLIRPKAYEQTLHPYDFDTAMLFSLLQKYGIEKEFKVNIEAIPHELGHYSHVHELVYAYTNHIFGGMDVNQKYLSNMTDSNLAAKQLNHIVQIIYVMLKNNDLMTGGFNVDTQLSDQSLELIDLYYTYIHAIDLLARGLLIANDLMTSGEIEKYVDQRYIQWQSPLGQEILKGKMDFEKMTQYVLEHNLHPETSAAQSDLLENMIHF